MQNTLQRYGTIGFIVVSMFLTILAIMSLSSSKASASAPSGLLATMATTSQFAITTAQQLMFATSTCSARIITTRTQPVMLTFTDKQGVVPTASLGHLQEASTTRAYDSGIYGCGAVRVISGTLITDTIFVSETQ